MADEVCGPSNALQNLQKQSTADRTLEQDRLTSRASPSQGFRSSPTPGAGTLDHEFEAFKAGQLPLQPTDPHGYASVGYPSRHAAQKFNASGPASWATDFQNMNLGGVPQASRQIGHAPQANQAFGGGWQHEFAKQQAQQPNQVAGSSSSQRNNYNVPYERLSSITPMAQTWQPMQMASTTMNREKVQQPVTQPAEKFDDEAFARAFDEAAKATEMAQGQSQAGQSGVLMDESAERLMSAQRVEGQKIGADLIHDPENEENEEAEDESDALARTAAQLLDSLKDNKSEKFQKSQFLSLMRQFRDREVMIKGDKIVGIISQEDKDALEGIVRP